MKTAGTASTIQSLGVLFTVTVASIASVHAAPARIAPQCGDTIGPGGSYVLTADIGPCSTPVALTIDSANLNMAGHTVSGNSLEQGIVLVGSGAILRNGTVHSFGSHGVTLAGLGRHTVKNVTSTRNGLSGFVVDSGHNGLRNNKAIGNAEIGFSLESDSNRVSSSTADGNGADGFEIEGSANRVARNTSHGNGSDGFDYDGVDNVSVANRATANGDDGFDVPTSNNIFSLNVALENGDNGFELTGVGNRLRTNRARGNRNLDANDQTDACESNIWVQNSFGTTLPACIR